jgi:hypothetical protein
MWVKKRGGAKGGLMVPIVDSMGEPLNAHFCRCLAHFYIALEKKGKSTHTVSVGNSAWSKRI